MAERLEIGYTTLIRYQTISKAYEIANRFANLSFKHHQIAVSLEDRLEWLKEAEAKAWKTPRLQYEIRNKTKRDKRLLLPPGTFNVIYADPA